MRTANRFLMAKQVYHPADVGSHNTTVVRSMGLDSICPEQTIVHGGREWRRHQVMRGETFRLVSLEAQLTTNDHVGYTRQEDYIKVNFWLSGKHSTVLDCYGQCDHDRPEVYITSGPRDMLKVDVLNKGAPIAVVALCLLRDFFPIHMGVEADELPEPLRAIVTSTDPSYGFHRFAFTPDLFVAARAVLAAPFEVRSSPIYAEAKAMELMCLLMNRLSLDASHADRYLAQHPRRELQLLEACELVTRRFAEPLTLSMIGRHVGMNKMTLTAGFKQKFGMSVHDYLQKVRMERAYELIQRGDRTVASVAEAVGYSHQCNFATAFRSYYGCSPTALRAGNRSLPPRGRPAGCRRTLRKGIDR